MCRHTVSSLVVLVAFTFLPGGDVTFSKEDVALLKKIHTVSDLSKTAGVLLLTAPIIDVLSASDPATLTVTVTNTDWDGMPKAALQIKQITACKIQDMIDAHLYGSSTDGPSVSAQEYFRRLHESLDGSCNR